MTPLRAPRRFPTINPCGLAARTAVVAVLLMLLAAAQYLEGDASGATVFLAFVPVITVLALLQARRTHEGGPTEGSPEPFISQVDHLDTPL
ncbi:MAG TPA: hypothetical protein VNT51_03845 [Miltoncostaeaceae bacterium]|nr:hypothetical protein [Miltoncostaeaceae bacterium]